LKPASARKPGRARRILRALVIALALLVLVVVVAFRPVLHALCGASARTPDQYATISAEARALVDRSLADLDAARMIDVHVHVPGLGAGGSGCSVNPRLLSWWSPVRHFQFLAYCDAGRITDLEHAEQQYVERLIALVRGMPKHGKFGLLAFDARHGPDGTRDDDRTEMFTPDSWPISIAREDPDLFVPIISVHPYRKDALDALVRGAQAGARYVKWLPNAMGIDAADPRCDAYYDKMKALGLSLLTHTGSEEAVHAAEDQEFGNPLRLRRALDRGVKVVLAHCASAGTNQDLDDPNHPQVDAFDLFLRIMDDPKYVGLAFGEISTLTQRNRCGRPLATMLERTDLHERLINGSDYPLPAFNVLYSTKQLQGLGYITAEERALLNEVYDVNPLLYDLVLKRCVKHPSSGTRFPPSVFMSR
jgi:predicted TIM-barrel fold metal-dependent hydrolase